MGDIPKFGGPGEMSWQEVKNFLDHIRVTCMDERQALKLEVRKLKQEIVRHGWSGDCSRCAALVGKT